MFAKLFDRSGAEEPKITVNLEIGTVAKVIKDGPVGDPYVVKPIADLYGTRSGLDSVDPTSDTFAPLLMCIEEVFVSSYRKNKSVTDSTVIASLDKLCMSPEADTSKDLLAKGVQFALWLALSLNDYSRQDVRLCLRKIKQSVIRHNKNSGTRGYLQFVDEYMP